MLITSYTIAALIEFADRHVKEGTAELTKFKDELTKDLAAGGVRTLEWSSIAAAASAKIEVGTIVGGFARTVTVLPEVVMPKGKMSLAQFKQYVLQQAAVAMRNTDNSSSHSHRMMASAKCYEYSYYVDFISKMPDKVEE